MEQEINIVFQDGLCSYLLHDQSKTLLVIQPNSSLDLFSCIKKNNSVIEELLFKYGAILFRGFSVDSVSDFQANASLLVPDLFDYQNRSTPRTKVDAKIFTSTEYPEEFIIPLHNECSYSHLWPEKILFFCLIEPKVGGETPIANSHKVYNTISQSTVEKFVKKKVMYTRNYENNVGLSWQEVFQTSNKNEVEKYCLEAGIKWEWLLQDKLRTKQIRPAVIKHPITGVNIWFNQAHLFNVYMLEKDIRKQLLDAYGEHNLPRNSYYGDGSPIEQSTLDEISAAYNTNQFKFLWQKGDILLLDNILFSHGRMTFSGERKILVAMGK